MTKRMWPGNHSVRCRACKPWRNVLGYWAADVPRDDRWVHGSDDWWTPAKFSVLRDRTTRHDKKTNRSRQLFCNGEKMYKRARYTDVTTGHTDTTVHNLERFLEHFSYFSRTSNVTQVSGLSRNCTWSLVWEFIILTIASMLLLRCTNTKIITLIIMLFILLSTDEVTPS